MNYSLFIQTGHALFQNGLLTAASGNLSVRSGDNLIITCTGSELGNLEEKDLIETGIFKDDEFSCLASSELPVHRDIYKTTSAMAIVHAHPPYSTALSLKEKEIIPDSSDIVELIGTVPVIGWGMEVVPGGFSDNIAEMLKDHHIVMVFGHGSFAVGQTLDEAFGYTLELEEYCKINCEIELAELDTGNQI